MMTMNESVPETMLICFNNDRGKFARQEASILPKFGEFQLIGDSLLVRFADQILQQRPGSNHGTRAVGYCINGQRIDQLRQRIKKKMYPLSSKVLVLIGTVDVLCGRNIYTMTKNFNALLALLKKNTEKLLILTLPPIPKLCATYFHWTLIRQFNSFLRSLSDGKNIVVADICPLFTKFKGALEYDINIDRELQSVHYLKKRKSFLNHRRKSIGEQRNLEGIESDLSESDYRNTTDTNTSIDSEILSSELSQERENHQSMDMLNAAEGQTKSKTKKGSERVQSPVRFVVRTLQSVFGKDMLNRKKTQAEAEPTLHPVKNLEKRSRNSSLDMSANICYADNWEIESDGDSMHEHVYKSQEEIEYDTVEIENQRRKNKCGEFSKFVESLNEYEETPKRNFHSRRRKRDCLRNERPETTESSSSSDTEPPKKQIGSFVDHNFRYFLEKSWHAAKEIDCPTNSGIESYSSSVNLSEKFNHAMDFFRFSVNSPMPEKQTQKVKNSRQLLLEQRGHKSMDGMSERDRLILHLASKICYLECYEIFYPFGKKRLNMVHLNRRGLVELKNFLVSNNYVSL